MRIPLTVRRRVSRVTFCESCGQACNAACRADAQRDRTRTQGLSRAIGLR